MSVRPEDRRPHYHVVGVAGVGMSALAQALVDSGARVSGSDRQRDAGRAPEVLRKLAASGVALVPQDGGGVTAQTRALVVSTAIEPDNADRTAAGRLGVEIVHRAEMLARLCAGRPCVAVTGTSGKSTVTGMIGWALDRAGADPTVVNGAPVLNWRTPTAVGNVRWGRSGLWVIEADESDRSLLQFRPDWAVITNASQDHFGLEETRSLFRRFAAQARCGVVDGTEPGAFRADAPPDVSAHGVRFRYRGVGFELPLPGAHNAANALCAAAVCERLGVALQDVSGALREFRGIERRLEFVGEAAGVTVIDDYAHNPAKIRAAWDAAAPYARRVVAVWRPHGYGPLASMMDALAATFADVCRPADRVILLPVYDAGGTANRSVNAAMLAERLAARNVQAACAQTLAEAAALAADSAAAGDTVMTMGARDPDLPRLAAAILGRLRGRASAPAP